MIINTSYLLGEAPFIWEGLHSKTAQRSCV